jgi:hypothetical protein
MSPAMNSTRSSVGRIGGGLVAGHTDDDAHAGQRGGAGGGRRAGRVTGDREAGGVDVAREEGQPVGGRAEGGDLRGDVSGEIAAAGRRVGAQHRQHVAQHQAGVIGGDDDEAAAGPVGDDRQRLVAERGGAVDEHHGGVRTVRVVERQVAVAVAVLPRVVGVADGGALRGVERLADVVARGGLADLAAARGGVPHLDLAEPPDADGAGADRPRPARGRIGRLGQQRRAVAAGDVLHRRIGGAVVAATRGQRDGHGELGDDRRGARHGQTLAPDRGGDRGGRGPAGARGDHRRCKPAYSDFPRARRGAGGGDRTVR